MQIALQAVEMRVLARRENGGATVELPVLRTATINRGKTHSGGDGELTISRSDLEQIVANFDPMGRPVPVGFGEHQEFGDRGGPSPAFVDSVRVDGDTLLAVVSLNPEAAAAVVDGEMFRGFSVEMGLDRVTPTGELKGWSLHGGIFTNRPAAPIHFAPPMNGPAEVAASVSFSIRPEMPVTEVQPMAQDTVSLEALQAEKEAQDEKIVNLEESLNAAVKSRDTLTETNADLSRKLETAEDKIRMAEAVTKAKTNTATELEERISKQDKQLADLSQRLKDEATKREEREVREKIQTAIYDGVRPASFDGYKDDPIAWLQEKFDGSSRALDTYIAALPRDEKLAERYAVSAGRPPTGADDAEADIAGLSEETVTKVKGMGLDPRFANVTDATQARKLAAQLAAKNKG